MSNSKTALITLAFAGLSTLGSAVNITAIDGSQGWIANGFSGGGTAGIVATPTNDGDGSLNMTGDRSRVTYFTGSSLGSLGNLVNGNIQFDFYRAAASTAVDGRYQIALKLFVTNAGGQTGSITWENAYNGQVTAEDTWFNDVVLNGTGQWWIRSGTTNYDQAANLRTIGQWVSGGTVTDGSTTSIELGANTQVTAFELAVGSGITGTFNGNVDDVRVAFAGGNQYNSNFQAVPEPGTIAALGLGAVALIRRRRKASK